VQWPSLCLLKHKILKTPKQSILKRLKTRKPRLYVLTTPASKKCQHCCCYTMKYFSKAPVSEGKWQHPNLFALASFKHTFTACCWVNAAAETLASLRREPCQGEHAVLPAGLTRHATHTDRDKTESAPKCTIHKGNGRRGRMGKETNGTGKRYPSSKQIAPEQLLF